MNPSVATRTSSGGVALGELIDELDAVVWEARAAEQLEFTYVSRAAERILGHPLASWYGDPGFWSRNIHPDDRDRAVATCADAVQRREHQTFEYRWVKGDGQVVWLRDIVRVTGAAAGAVLLRGVMVDVSDLRRLRLMLDNAQDCVFRLYPGPAPRFDYISPSCQHLTGRPPEEFLGDALKAMEAAHPDDRERVRQALAGQTTGRDATRFVRPDGSVVWVETAVHVVEDESGRRVVEGVGRDVTERVLAEQRSSRAQALFEAAFAQAPIGMGLGSLEADRVDELVEVNDALCRLLGRSREELLGRPLDDLTHPEDRGRSLELKRKLRAGEIPSFYVEKRYVRGDGSVVWAGLHGGVVRDADGELLVGLGQIEDVSDRRAFEHELAQRALHDGLTGLPNHQLFMDRLTSALAQRPRTSAEHVAVFFLDLDDLKAVNDRLGHTAGDAVIRQVGTRLRDALRPGDTIARLAGDEFTVLCPSVPGPEAAVALASRLLAGLEDPIEVGGDCVHVPASAGVAVAAPGAETTAHALFGDADTALLRAKELGKARVQLFDAALRVRGGARRKHTGAELRRALEHDELCVLYQPIVDLGSGAIRGAEALVRWRHPDRALLAPAEFIPIAERTGSIVDLGRWVFQRACADHSRFTAGNGRGPILLSTNLSSRELAEPSLCDEIAEAVQRAGADPSLLSFEITETSIVEEPEGALRTLRGLQELGALVAIDDFGKGHSSLAQLKSFPVDVLKLDRLFVRGLEGNERDVALVAAVVAMADALGLRLVVEGIEDSRQRDRLVELGCRWGQGFLFGRPMPAAELAALLA